MKIAPLYHALKKEKWADPRIIHTGQHYDVNMSDAFFTDLNMPESYLHMGVGSGTHAEQTGRVMIAYEKVIIEERPDLIVVVGDVNSTMAATLAASKLRIPVAHLEAGLRSFDRAMPEEINRIVTDSLADILWTPSPDGDANLLREGVEKEKIVRVGNIMIDCLEMLRGKIESKQIYKEMGQERGAYGVVTIHRPSNVDDPEILETICNSLILISESIPLIFPIHPRTRKNLNSNGLLGRISSTDAIKLTEPIGYISFMNLVFNCKMVITDSGGIQEETTYLGIPCFTLRNNTERPVTITQGTNRLCNPENLLTEVEKGLDNSDKAGSIPDMWDGKTAQRTVQSIRNFLMNTGQS